LPAGQHIGFFGVVRWNNALIPGTTIDWIERYGILNGVANFDVTVGNVESSVQLAFHSIWNGASGELKFTSWQATHVA
jgi:hypothetical protein